MIVLPITITIAAAAALLNLWIAGRISPLRRRHKVWIGDGGIEPLAARIRAHANFIEYTPFFLILLGLVELAEGSMRWLWAVAIIYVIGRILHVFGMDRLTLNRLRTVGIGLSLVALLGLAIYALTIPYRHRMPARTITFVAATQPPAIALSPTKGFVRRS